MFFIIFIITYLQSCCLLFHITKRLTSCIILYIQLIFTMACCLNKEHINVKLVKTKIFLFIQLGGIS